MQTIVEYIFTSAGCCKRANVYFNTNVYKTYVKSSLFYFDLLLLVFLIQTFPVNWLGGSIHHF